MSPTADVMSLIGRAMAWIGAARAAGHNNTEVGQCYVSRQHNTNTTAWLYQQKRRPSVRRSGNAIIGQ